MNKTYFSILMSLVLPCIVLGQSDKKAKKAANKFEQRAYANAIASYEDLVESGYTSEEAYKSLGDAHYYNADYKSAANWYGRLFEQEGATIDSEYLYRYAQTLKSMGNYGESDKWMQKLQSTKNDDIRAQKFVSKTDYLQKIKETSGRYEIENAGFNSPVSDFAPSFYNDGLVFSSARDTGKVVERIHSWNNKPFLNLYQTKKMEGDGYSEATKLSTVLNKKTHESSTVFTKDGNTVYFTRNNSDNGRFNRDDQGVSRLKLYRANLVEGEWRNIMELPFNSDDHSVAHPALGPDEKQLYFASDMPGTYGASDIFVVQINDDGSFGTPRNLGPSINTESRETFPFVSDDNVLYFASDGHPGLGGLDIFATKINDANNLFVVNLGEPVNGTQDDFSYIVKESKGFFASNREGGLGSDDIYSFNENEPLDLDCTTLIEGIVIDRESNNPLGNANLTLMDPDGKVVAETASSTDGTFKMGGSCKKGNYTIVAEKSDYNGSDTKFDVMDANDVSGVRLTLEKSIQEAEVGTELMKFLGLNPIYFDLDESAIRPDAQASLQKLVDYLKQFPNIKIEIRSHTDAKAGTSYNKRLSDRRAKETKDYLVSKGINAERLSSKGYGESELVNDCSDWQKCDDQQNEMNRRSEFIVIK